MQLIGVALLVAAGVMVYIALSQPKVYETISPSVTVTQSAEMQDANSSDEQAEQAGNVSAQSSTAAETTTVFVNVETVTAKETTQGTTVLQVTYPLNLNTATLEELMTIDGLGEKRASAILEYRDFLGGYSDVSQIMNIQGINEGVYAQIAGYLTV